VSWADGRWYVVANLRAYSTHAEATVELVEAGSNHSPDGHGSSLVALR